MKKRSALFGKIFVTALVVVGGVVASGLCRNQDAQTASPKPVIRSSSSIGDVAFPHQFHFEDLEFECQTCHHETNASALNMPHEDYFEDFWIDCRICHKGDGSTASQPQSCSNCHHSSPTDIADETLSSKVVIHKKCWECHELIVGEKASQGCSECHIQNEDKKEIQSISSMKGQSR